MMLDWDLTVAAGCFAARAVHANRHDTDDAPPTALWHRCEHQSCCPAKGNPHCPLAVTDAGEGAQWAWRKVITARTRRWSSSASGRFSLVRIARTCFWTVPS